MSIKRSYISSPALTFAILCIGLGCIVAATLKQNLAIAGLVAALPVLLCNPLAELSQCILDSSNGSIINVI